MKHYFNLSLLFLLLISSISEVFAQQDKVITGYVYSTSNNSPLEGIKVSTKYRKVKSVSTDNKGLFSIEVKDTLNTKSFMFLFSYPGYELKEQYGNQADTMKVYLTETGEYYIDEPVYYPYGDKKYTNLTSAVEKVNFTYSNQIMSSTFEQLLENSTINVTSSSGSPGEGKSLNIRGFSTIFADEKPLIVIDGQILGNYRFEETAMDGYYHDPLINIDPRNIQQISILKDAPSAALYGARAANGVIIIKTKKAKVGKTEFDISGFSGVNYMKDRLPVISNSNYLKPYLLEQMYGKGYQIIDEYFIEDESYNKYYNYNNNTNWQDEVFGLGNSYGANVSVRGGDAIAKYFFSGGYLHDEGSVKNTYYNRFNARFNADIDINDWLTAQANMGVSYSNGQFKQQGLSYANPIYTALIKAPFLYPFKKDSNNIDLPKASDADQMGVSNPYEVINQSELDMSSYNFIGSLNLKFKISKHIEGNVIGNAELNKINQTIFLPDWGFYNIDYPNDNQIKKGISNFNRISFEANLKYNKTFDEVHNLSGIIGIREFFDEINQDLSSGVGTPSDQFKDMGGTKSEGRTKSGYQLLRKDINSFLGLSYNFMEEYFVDLTIATDVSSNVGVNATPKIMNVPVAFSPALGLGWNLTNKAGLDYSTTINYLKLRLSGGQIANVIYNPFYSKNFYASNQYYTAAGISKSILENEELAWERTNKINFGADLALFKQKLFVACDLYYHNTTGILNNSSSTIEYGTEFWQNSGDINTLGSELTFKLRAYEGPSFKWNSELALGQYNTTISNLEKDLLLDFGSGKKLFRNDEKAGSFYGYEVVGVISSDAEANSLNLIHANGSQFKAGDIQFKDHDNNKIINDDDKVAIGNAAPDFYGSWVNKFTYNQVSLLTDISFVYGNEIYNHTRRELESMSGFENQSKATRRRWQEDGQETDMPASSWGDPIGNSRFSDRWIEDGSYWRLKRITLSINLNKWLKSANNSEFYISGINLITMDNYLGYDPEFAYGSSIIWEGIDYMKFPQNKSIMIGLKFGL